MIFIFFFGMKLVFLGLYTFSNVYVLHKGLLLQDWVFRLGWLIFYKETQLRIAFLYIFTLVSCTKLHDKPDRARKTFSLNKVK